MPAHSRSPDSTSDDVVQLQRNNPNGSEESEQGDVELEDRESDDDDDDGSRGSSCSDDDEDEFVYVKLAEVRTDVQCPICLGIIRKTRKVMECLHRFCRECIDKSMRLGNNECPACRAHCASRRSLRDDPNFDTLIALLYPDIDQYEAEELAFCDDEKARNKQIQESIAQTSLRQLEALGKKRPNAKATETTYTRRSQSNTRNLRGRKRQRSPEPQDSDSEADTESGKYSSSADELEPPAEVKTIQYKRWSRGSSSLPSSSGANVSKPEGNDSKPEGSRRKVGGSVGRAGSPEVLAWGRGGMRSHTRVGGQCSSGKIAKISHKSKLIPHLQKLPQNDDELDINLKLVSLYEESVPNLQNLYVCCKPTMSTTNICHYVATENGLRADEIELLAVKGSIYDDVPLRLRFSGVLPDEPSKPVISLLTHKLQVLKDHQNMSDVAKISCQNDLTIAYRKKIWWT